MRVIALDGNTRVNNCMFGFFIEVYILNACLYRRYVSGVNRVLKLAFLILTFNIMLNLSEFVQLIPAHSTDVLPSVIIRVRHVIDNL